LLVVCAIGCSSMASGLFFSFFFMLFVFKDRVVEEFSPLFWCGLVLKTWKGMVLLTCKGMVTNVLNSFLDWVLTRMFQISLCLAWLLWLSVFSRSVEICRFQVVLSVYTPVVFVARKSFYACCTVQGDVGTCILFPWWRSIHSSFLNSNCFGRGFILIFF
jgi:hypothetical protein